MNRKERNGNGWHQEEVADGKNIGKCPKSRRPRGKIGPSSQGKESLTPREKEKRQRGQVKPANKKRSTAPNNPHRTDCKEPTGKNVQTGRSAANLTEKNRGTLWGGHPAAGKEQIAKISRDAGERCKIAKGPR